MANYNDPNYGVPQYGRDELLHPVDAQRQDPLWHVPSPEPHQPMIPTPLPAPGGMGMPMPVGNFAPIARASQGGDLLLNLIFVGFLWEVWVCLYPLSALAGLFTLVYAIPFLRGVLPEASIIGPGLYAVVLGFVAAAVALWNVSRLEHVLARHGVYRVLRHLVRLPLLGLATVIAIQKAQGFPYDPTLAGVRRVIDAPVNVAIVVGVMIASHFVLWNWKRAREFWHARLVGARLRKYGS